MKILHILILFILSFGITSAQSSFSSQLISVTSHPFAKHNKTLHQTKINNNEVFTLEPGVILSYDKYLFNKFALRISTSVLKDRFNSFSGNSQIC